MSQNENESKEDMHLNKHATEYIPSKNRIPDTLNFNLEAAEYKPKEIIEYIESDYDDEDQNDEQIQQEIDMIIGDVVENEVMDELANQRKLDNSSDDDSEDEDKWIHKYKDCKCCSGFVYHCKGEACSSLGECYCKMKDDIDDEENEGNEDKEPEKIRN